MKTTKLTAILLALVLLTTATVQAAKKPAKKEISNTRTASCLIKITTDEAVLPIDEFAIDYLLRSSGVAGKAAREVLDISPDEVSELFEIEEIFGVDSLLGGIGLGGYGGGMGLPADATPGASTPGASTYGTTATSRSTRRTTPTAAARTPSRTAATKPRPARTTTATRTPTRPTTSSSRRTTPTRPGTRTTTANSGYYLTPPRSSRAATPTRTTPTRTKTHRTPTVTQPLRSTAEQTILFRLQVYLDEGMIDTPIKPAAEEFMMALIDNLRSALRGAFDDYRKKFNQQLEFADNEAHSAESELVQMQARLRSISDSRDLSRYAILRDISSLRQKLQSTIMNRASDEKLYEATAERIAEEQTRRKKLVEDDPITRELKSILDVHKKRLESIALLVEAGSTTPVELEDAREKIIRARIELAKRQEEVSNPPGSIVLSSLNDEMADLSTKVALAQQEINLFEVQLEEAEGLLRKADDYELLSLKMDIARQNLEEALLWRARLGRNIRSIQPPDVTVIGAE